MKNLYKKHSYELWLCFMLILWAFFMMGLIHYVGVDRSVGKLKTEQTQ